MQISWDEKRKLDLISEITSAFDGVSREGANTWHEVVAISWFANPEEAAKSRSLDKNKRWQDVSGESIIEECGAFHFLNAKGFRYYIPVCVIWCLRNVNDLSASPSAHAFNDLLHLLKPHGGGPICGFNFDVTPQLDTKQKKSIAHFLVFAAEQVERFRPEYEKMVRMHPYLRYVSAVREIEINQGRVTGEYNRVENPAQIALDRYWGQFV